MKNEDLFWLLLYLFCFFVFLYTSINPKSLFFEVSLENHKWNIMVTDRNHLTNWKEILVMRQWIKLDELKRVTISGVSIIYHGCNSYLCRVDNSQKCH
jgi:hypothetical protein